MTHAIAYGLVVTSIGGCAAKGNTVVSEPTGGALARVRIAALNDGLMGFIGAYVLIPTVAALARMSPVTAMS